MMSASTGYTSLPGSWGSELHKQSMVVINGVPVPAVPAGSGLALLVGLVMWSVGMLQARSTVDGIFSDLGLQAASLEHLKATVLAGVIVLLVLALLVLAANVWLLTERGGTTAGGQAAPALAVQAYGANVLRVNVGNWLLLLLVALAMAGSITWLTTMSAALSATQQSGGSPWAAANPAPAGQAVPEMGQLWASQADDSSSSSSNSACPPGCVDLGLIAEVLGLPWNCFCQVWLLKDLEGQLHKVVAQLWVAVVGVLLLFTGTSWLYGHLAAQGAHAARDLQDLLAGYHSQQQQQQSGGAGVRGVLLPQ